MMTMMMMMTAIDDVVLSLKIEFGPFPSSKDHGRRAKGQKK